MSSTRDRLVQTGFELFARHGFHAVGLDGILAEVGVSKQTCYNHFESKDELAVEVLARRDQFELEMFEQALARRAGHDARERLRSLFDVLDAWMNQPEFRGCIFLHAVAEFPNPHDPAHRAAAKHIMTLQAGLLEMATEAGADDPQAVAEGLMVLVEGAILLRQTTGRTDSAKVAGRTAALLLERHLPGVREAAPERAAHELAGSAA